MSFVEKLYKFFPTPKYLKKPTAGLSISDNHIRLVALNEDSKGLHIICHKEVSIPDGVIVSGEIQNKEDLISLLEKVRKETGFSAVRASMPEEKVYLFETEIPKVLQSEIKSTIEFKIEESVPLKAPETIFDYVILEEKIDSLKLVVSALPKNTIESYEEVIISAGFSLFNMSIESQTTADAVIKDTDKDLYMIVHFSSDKIGVYVVKDNIVRFTSTISILKNQDGFYNKAAFEVLKVINYWSDSISKDKNLHFNKIIVCGSDFDNSCLDIISQTTGVKASLANVWSNVFDLKDSVPEIGFEDSLRYASAIGLAIPKKFICI